MLEFIKKIFCFLLFSTCAIFAQEGRGTSGPSGGDVREIIIDPNDEQILYAITSTPYSGVFKSTDGRKSWFVLTKGLEFDKIDSGFRMPQELAIDIIDSNTLYVAINQPQTVGSSCLYKTTNGGEEWFPIKEDRIYALCAKDGSVFALGESGLSYSSNAGDSWITQNSSLAGDKILLDEQNVLWIGGSNGLFRSIDSGKTSQQFIFSHLWKINTFDVATVGEQKCIIVSNAASPSKYDSLYISYNEGITWINRTETLPYDSSLNSYEIPSVIKISKQNINNIFAGSSDSFFRTTDGGIHWIKHDSGLTLPHTILSNYQTIVSAIEISQQDSNIIFAGTTNDGIYRSSDMGITWQFLSMPSGRISTLSVSSSNNPDKIYCGATGGLYFFDDSLWIPTSMLIGQIDSWSGITASAISSHNTNFILVSLNNSINYGLLYKTLDGKTWSLKTMTPSEGRFTRILFDLSDPNRVYAVWLASKQTEHGGILVSDDNGNSWNILQKGLEPIDMVIDPTDNQRLYILERWGAIHLSTDKGITWNTIRVETDSEHTVIKFDPTNSQRIYLGSYYLFISEDRGATWVRKSFDKRITDIAIDTETGEVFVGTYKEGIWCSTDGGNTFNKMPSLPSERITKLLFYIKGKQKKLVAGTEGVGAYIYDLGTISSVSENNFVLKTFTLFQNYPNPFNPATQIKYSIKEDGLVILKVYDILGREITTLVNEIKLAGNYTVNFNASNLSSGIYFYSITSGNFNAVKKMLLLR